MKTLRILLTGALIVGAAGASAAAAAPAAAPAVAAAPERLADAQLAVTPRVILAGELNPGALGSLAPAETVVIDLRVPEPAAAAASADGASAAGVSAAGAPTGVAAEAAEAARLGIEYHNVPVDGARVGEEQLDAVAESLAQAGSRTVVLHCATGNRASLVWGALELRSGKPLAEVMETVSPVATREPIRRALAEYAESLPGAGSAEH